jgi:hypothetical protein
MNHRPNVLRSILLCGLLVLGGLRVSHATNFEDFGKKRSNFS